MSKLAEELIDNEKKEIPQFISKDYKPEIILNTSLKEMVPLLREKKSNIDWEAVVEFLGHYKSKHWIYPDAMHRNLKISIKDIYEILEICVGIGLLEQYLQIYCSRCQKFTGQYYKTIFEIPSDMDCVHCNEEITNPLEHAISIYRML